MNEIVYNFILVGISKLFKKIKKIKIIIAIPTI